MGKREQAAHRSPGTLSPFANGADAAERLSVLDDITDRFAHWEQQPEEHTVNEDRPPLTELSELLGVEIADVQRGARMKHRSGGVGLHQPLAWQLTTASGVRSPCFTSDELRREDRLNEVALTHWRRPLSMGRLTTQDGRTVLRLMHEHIESKENGS